MARIVDVVRAVAPKAKAPYIEAFDQVGDALFAQFEINTPERAAQFLARCLSETGGFSVLVESAAYTRKNLSDQWDRGNGHNQFGSKAEMVSYAGKPEALFNRWYGGRMGNGGPETGDGFRYRGRGPLQTTGKAAYRKYGKRAGVDLVADPDLLLDPRYILLPSLYEWQDGKLNAYADKGDTLSIARIINVGTARTSQIPNGYEEQMAALRRVKAAIKRLGWEAGAVPADAAPAPPAPAPEPNAPVEPVTIDPTDGLSEDEIREIQKLLRAKKYFSVGRVDGFWGPNTAEALRKFQEAVGLPVTASKDRAWVDPDTLAALVVGPNAQVSESRSTTTASTLREHGDAVAKSAFRTRVTAVLGGVGAFVVGVVQQIDTALGYVGSLASSVPMWVYVGAAVGVAAALYLNARNTEKAAVANVRDGRDAGPA